MRSARRDGRMRDGRLITLEEQDRSVWKRDEITVASRLLESALQRGPAAGPYQVQAAIAAVHAEAPEAERTDWRQISLLYERLFELQPTPVVALNHAVAVAMSDGWTAGLSAIEAANGDGKLDGYYLFHAARADILRRVGRVADASAAYRQAIDLTSNPRECEYLEGRLAALENPKK